MQIDQYMEQKKIRLDKWLWAARFYRTRAKSKNAIDGGKVHIDGVRGKPGKEIQIGDQIEIRLGWDETTVIVQGLSEKRNGAEQAQLLYQETDASMEHRLQIAEQRRAAGNQVISDGRPSKKDRRLIHKFRDQNFD